MSMGEILANAALFLAVLYICYVFMEQITRTAGELRERGESETRREISDLFLAMSPEAFFTLRVALVVIMFLFGTYLVNVALGLLMAGFGFIVPQVYVGSIRRRRLKQITDQLVDGLELMGNGLKSGLTLAQAIELLVREFPPPLSQEFRQVLSDNKMGVEIGEALNRMSVRLKLPVVDILTSGVGITKRCGGDLTEIFQNIADTIRAQATIEGKLQAVTAQGRFQGLVLGIMPFALMVVLWFIDRPHVEMLFEYKIGLMAVALVVVMVVLAQIWIQRMLKIDV